MCEETLAGMMWGDGEARACAKVLRHDEGGRAGRNAVPMSVKEVTVAAARWWPLPVELGLCGVVPPFMSRRPPAYIRMLRVLRRVSRPSGPELSRFSSWRSLNVEPVMCVVLPALHCARGMCSRAR